MFIIKCFIYCFLVVLLHTRTLKLSSPKLATASFDRREQVGPFGKDCAKIRKPPENTFLSIWFIRNINTFVSANSF